MDKSVAAIEPKFVNLSTQLEMLNKEQVQTYANELFSQLRKLQSEMRRIEALANHWQETANRMKESFK